MAKLCLIPLLILGLAGCKTDSTDASHAHEEGEAIQITLWNEEIELFVEYPPVVAGEPTRFVTHVTHIEQWRPRTVGEIHLILAKAGETPIEIRDPSPARDGIYLPSLVFPNAGVWTLEVRVPLEEKTSVLKIPDVVVYPTRHEAMHRPAGEDTEGITFLKEQQWRMPFASEVVTEQVFRESLNANGFIEPRAGGEVVIHAPVNGLLSAADGTFPHIGNRVDRGQILGSLNPRLDPGDDSATLTLAVQKTGLGLEFAQKELARIQALVQKEAIPENRLLRAELDVKTAQAEQTAAQERLRQFSAAQKESRDPAKGRVDLYSPLAGTIVEANVVAGALVAEGDRLFQIMDLARVWLNIQIPEADLGRISGAHGAWFRVEGLDRIFQVDTQSGGHLIALGGKIDPQRRTVPLIFQIPNPDQVLKIGMFTQVSVLTGQTATGPSIPSAALVEESGQSVAYVQASGESFQRRILHLGFRDGDRVQVLSGLAAGERVVTTGAYLIRLAAASTTLPAHGHEH